MGKLKKLLKKLSILFFGALVLLFTFWFFFLVFSKDSKIIAEVSEVVRESFAYALKPMPSVPYQRIFGFEPTEEIVELGRLLFNDPILSRNNDVSCATCHLSNHGYSTGMSLPFGALGQGGPTGETVGTRFAEGELSRLRSCADDSMGFHCSAPFFRNVPSTMNVAFRANPDKDEGLLWDGRFGRLIFQVLLPIMTAEELCGNNPIPNSVELNLFLKGGVLFDEPVEVRNTFAEDLYLGRNLPFFNTLPKIIEGVPLIRPSGSLSVPTRNECLAIALAKLRRVPQYRRLFARAFNVENWNDRHVGIALAAFVATHVIANTPYDQFVAGQNSLSLQELKGLVAFSLQPGEEFDLAGHSLRGAGCINCHSPPQFGGEGFASLGVRSDPRSQRSQPGVIFQRNQERIQIRNARKGVPYCHIEGVTVNQSGRYGPDMGRAEVTGRVEDCFRFRVPPLRNVIETFPYFHHGTETAQGYLTDNFKKLSLRALRNVIKYHLRGAVDIDLYNRQSIEKQYYDFFFQRDSLIRADRQNFFDLEQKANHLFPIELSDEEINNVLEFIAFGLWDRDAVTKGDLGNSLRHPRRVPSGFTPTITRDFGHQGELPPNSR